MFKFILGLALFSMSISAFARYPDGKCAPNETKLIYDGQIVFGKRVQITAPLLCANGHYFPILAFDASDRYSEHVAGLCGLYQMGTSVTYDIRPVDHEELASFDEKGNFNGVMDFKKAEENEIYALKSLTCQLP